jgi:uncharacterized protein (DUF983 family)
MKYCTKCKTSKSKEEFAKNKTAKDGLQHYCRTCYTKIHREYRKTKEGKSVRAQNARDYRAKGENISTHAVRVHFAVKKGILQKEPCAVCGEENVQAHHEDYSDSLKVVWLCQKHHQEADQQRRLREKAKTRA